MLALATSLLGAPAASAHIVGPQLPANDLEALLALGGNELAPMKPVRTLRAGSLRPAPRAECDDASHPLKGMQGRVPDSAINSPDAAHGWTCNLKTVAHHSTPGGFRVWRYTDRAGNTCAFYDTSLNSPANIASVGGGPSPGVAVLDMANPAEPRQTASLTTPGMLAPHESLNLNRRRGLLAAEVGNGLTLPGTLDIYDVAADCRHPQLLSSLPTKTGHESGFSPDGNTYWVAGGGGYIDAVDVTDPANPSVVWEGAYYSHGLSLSPDGRTLYQTDPINGNLGILDVSQVQDRVANPIVPEISRVTWNRVSIPQNTVPLTIHGKPMLLEFDEFAFRFNPPTVADQVGAARLINVANPREPRLVSDLRLRVNMAAEHEKASVDTSPLPPTTAFGYSAHYCAAPERVDPQIVACSFTNSGLRVFDISRPRHPREVAYFVAPPKDGTVADLLPGNLALSQPAFDPDRREVWYTDAGSGFYVLKLARSVWSRVR